MLRKILIGLAAVLALLVLAIATRPGSFQVRRSRVIAAAPSAVFPHVNDFHQWEAWSPWAKLDPNAKVTFEGAESGKGAVFHWDGNNEVGTGRQEIVESDPSGKIRIRLDFQKPFEASSEAEFTFAPDAGGTLVTWTMSGHNNFIGKAISLFMDCDKMVGGQFEQGLANLDRIVSGKSEPATP